MANHSRAGQPAQQSDLINVAQLTAQYYVLKPVVGNAEHAVKFGTSGHRGSAARHSFNEPHILAIAQAIAEERAKNGVTGPCYVGKDTHALSEPAFISVLEVLTANGVPVVTTPSQGGTTIVTMDNVTTIVGNGKVFGDNIQNYSALPVRRVDCVAKVANSVNPLDAIARLKPVIAAIPNVAASPAPDIEILEFTPEGPKLCVRPYTHTDHYWQVYFDTHKAIVETFGAAGYPVPELPVAHRTVTSA